MLLADHAVAMAMTMRLAGQSLVITPVAQVAFHARGNGELSLLNRIVVGPPALARLRWCVCVHTDLTVPWVQKCLVNLFVILSYTWLSIDGTQLHRFIAFALWEPGEFAPESSPAKHSL